MYSEQNMHISYLYQKKADEEARDAEPGPQSSHVRHTLEAYQNN